MKKILIFILITAMPLHWLVAQTLKVKDKITLEPIPGVNILSGNSSLLIKTNSKGEADISLFKNTDSITIQAFTYHPMKTTYQILESQSFSLMLVPKVIEMDEVVISVNRVEEKKSDLPQQVQVMTSKEIQFMNQPTTGELMQNSGNVLVQKSQMGGGSPIIRGFEANKVLIVVDGVRMNNAIFRGGHLQNIITMDNAIFDRAEIVFGPGSVVYGSDALGGVMHFYTKKPILADSLSKKKIKGNAFTRYATAYQEKTGHLDLNFGFKKIGFLSSFTFSNFGDLRQGNNRNPFYGDWGKRLYYPQRIDGKDSMVVNKDPNIQKESGYTQYDFLQKILLQQNKNISHLLNFQYSTSSNIPRYDRLSEVNSSGKLKNAEWYYGPQKRMLTSYNLNLDSKSKIYNNAKMIIAYQKIEESRHNRGFGSSKLNHRVEHVDVVSLNIDLNKKTERNEIRYGVEVTYNKVNSKATATNILTGIDSPLDTRYPSGGSAMRTMAGYITHTLELSPKLIITEGVRYSNIYLNSNFTDKTFFPFPFSDVTQKSSAFNGNIGLIVMPGTTGWRFTALGSSGFRAPNVDDMTKVFESVPGSVIIPNPDLKPEYTYNAETGISKLINKKTRIEGIAYYTWYKNALTTRKSDFNSIDSIMYDGSLSSVTTTVNAANAYIYGFSVNLSADITNAFSIASTVNYTYGRIKTDTTDYPLDHIPPVFGKTSFNLKISKFRMEFFVMYNGWKRLKNYNLIGEDNISYATSHGIPAWMTLNIRTSYYFNEYVQVQIGLENILDQNYRVFASGISAPGRNLVLTVRGRF